MRCSELYRKLHDIWIKFNTCIVKKTVAKLFYCWRNNSSSFGITPSSGKTQQYIIARRPLMSKINSRVASKINSRVASESGLSSPRFYLSLRRWMYWYGEGKPIPWKTKRCVVSVFTKPFSVQLTGEAEPWMEAQSSIMS